jgi:crotonobetainyl-CoA:carnitine CoA-transferase CaiB-like acyl-CoA transferase
MRSAISVRTRPASLTVGRVFYCLRKRLVPLTIYGFNRPWMNRMSGPLHGIKVLDMSRVLAGPWAAQLLGDLGADVVKVERPHRGDDTREWGPPWLTVGESRESAYYLSANRNKRSITIDLGNPRGAGVLRDLAAESDILIENFRVGTMQRFGLDAPVLTEMNPRLIYCSISAFGRDSSRKQEPGYDAMIQAEAGLMSITGPPEGDDGGPQKVGVAVADIMAGMYAVTGILAALESRHRTGQGQIIDVPLYDTQVAWLANQAMNYLVGGEIPTRLGTGHPNLVPYQTFESRDGHFTLAVGNDTQFAACVACFGREELARDPRFATNSARVKHREPLIRELEAIFRRESTDHWLSVFRSANVPVGPINTIDNVFTGHYAEERQLVRHVKHPLDPNLPTVANPLRFSETEVGHDGAPPMLGEHTRCVLEEWLGYSDSQIDALIAASAV